MAADKEAAKESRLLAEAGQWLRRNFLSFARDERFAEAFATALPIYWNGLYTFDDAEQMSQYEAFRFIDWFIFDYRHGDSPRLIDAYFHERWEDLSVHQQKVLVNWIDAPPASAYELLDFEGQILQLRDFLSGETFQVYEPGGHGIVVPGDLLLGRLVPLEDRLEFSTVIAYLPQDEIADLADKLEKARAADIEEFADATLAESMRRYGYLIIHHALEQAELKGRPPVAGHDPDRIDKLTRRAAQRLRKLQRGGG
jgi:hypothetical protein